MKMCMSSTSRCASTEATHRALAGLAGSIRVFHAVQRVWSELVVKSAQRSMDFHE